MNRGKIVIILCMALLSIQIASADILNLTASTNETFADNRTARITANLTNATGYPINNTRVNFTTDCGILSAGYNYTNASGIAVVNISSWDLYCKHHSTCAECHKRDSQCNICQGTDLADRTLCQFIWHCEHHTSGHDNSL
ncbi:MAG: hypothetical protein C5S48_03180 [Candidatus Methanogaster sp.]|nr:MAG: hypothetical protein C5S48_03180 [ANME-2 cluster archaeon]